MPTENDYLALKREAAERLRAGDLDGSIELQARLVEGLIALGPQALQKQPKLSGLLEDTAQELTDAWRWQRQYEPAIALQDRLVEYLPDAEPVLRLGGAMLRLESGQDDAGLAQLKELVEEEPDSIWNWISLGTGYLWLQDFEQAEAVLKQAAELSGARKIDRALAYRYLFDLFAQQGRTDEALATWREAGRLDATLRAELLPAVCRMLIYWRKFDEAARHTAMERSRTRQLFYQGLAAYHNGQPKVASDRWLELMGDLNPSRLKDGHDEYGEACLRTVNPAGAVLTLERFVQEGQVKYFRLVILGLAWAQQRNMVKARFYLDAALRLGDVDRPRRTRPAPQGRMLDIHARQLFDEIFLEPSLRELLKVYFIPQETS